ncbi:hypothetical protein [Streptomyces sp. WM6378]|uniref:hypothetical protein n=1 Tax=Streptomyces sp. WM6378 TaxID=1415557 RepID=UPI001F2D1197|nr:hypothetical protein [Streptomyces sp. WM6378]
MTNEQQAAETIRNWATPLANVPSTVSACHWDAARAVRRYYEQREGDRSAQFRPIEPGDILAAWAPFRGELLSRHVDPVPTADADDAAAYCSELSASRAAVASGLTAPSGQRRLGRGPGWSTSGSAAGGPIPAQIRRELAQLRLKGARAGQSHLIRVRAA